MTPKDIEHLDPCDEALEWLEANPGTIAQQWKKCPRGDWMLWLAAELGVDKKQIVKAACACARLVLHLIPKGENRPRKAIETAEAWCRDEATLGQVRIAARAAAEAYAARATYASYAAYVAAYATNAARAAYGAAAAGAADAAGAAVAIAYADAAARAAGAADARAAGAADARQKMHRKCAIEVAKHISWRDIQEARGTNLCNRHWQAYCDHTEADPED